MDLDATLGVLRRGAGDPTSHREPGGAWWLARRTPDGSGTLRLAVRRDEGVVEARSWGPGAQWLLGRVPALLGADDDPSGFEPPAAPRLAAAAARFPGWRVPATGLIVDSLVPAIIEQRVTGAEAFASQRMLVHRFGSPAPGPTPPGGRVLRVAPSAGEWRRVPSWEWVRAGVDSGRAGTVMRAVAVAGRLEECVGQPPELLRRRLLAIPGIGGWTAAEVAQRAVGDADAVSFGDYHVAADVTWALTGTVGDDAALERVLRPWAGHRYRVQRLVALAGLQRPRRGARRSLPTHLPTRWR